MGSSILPDTVARNFCFLQSAAITAKLNFVSVSESAQCDLVCKYPKEDPPSPDSSLAMLRACCAAASFPKISSRNGGTRKEVSSPLVPIKVVDAHRRTYSSVNQHPNSKPISGLIIAAEVAAGPAVSSAPAEIIPPIVANLSKAQLSVVFQNDDKSDQIVVAGPGTGKSFCLAARVVYLTMVKKIPGTSILVLGENVNHLSALVDFNTPLAHNTAAIKTFYHLARSLLKDFSGPDNTVAIPQLLSRAEEASFFESLKQSKKLVVPQSVLFRFSTDQIVRYFGMLSASGISPERYHSVAETLTRNLEVALKELKQQRISDREINLVHAGKIASVETHQTLAALYQRYRAEMRASNRTDGTGLLQMVVELIETNPAFKQFARSKYSYILVDNIQNLSELQFKVLKLLSGLAESDRPKNVLTLFGDDDQAIFSFKPSKKDIFECLFALLPDATVSNLTESFRSKRQPLLDSLRLLISQGRNRLEAKSPALSKFITKPEQASVLDDDEAPYYPQTPTDSDSHFDLAPGQDISVKVHHSEEAENEYIAQSIEAILQHGLSKRHEEQDEEDLKHLFPEETSPSGTQSYPKRLPSICVVSKTRRQASQIYDVLRSRGLPVSINAVQLKESPEIKFLVNFLRVLVRPTTASDSLYELVASSTGPYSLPPKSLGTVTETQITTQQPLRKVLEHFMHQTSNNKHDLLARKRVDRLLGDLDFFERLMKARSTAQIVYGILQRTELLQAARNPKTPEDEDVSRHLGSFLRICADVENKMRLSRVVDVLPALEHLLERSSAPIPAAGSATRSGGDVISQEEEPGFVKVLTPWNLTSSEFDHVFIPRCTEDMFPGLVDDPIASMVSSVVSLSKGKSSVESDPVSFSLEEQRRVFYVCLSRARKQVHLSYSTSKPNGQLNKPSRFISQTLNQLSGEVAQASRLAERAAAALRVLQRTEAPTTPRTPEPSSRSLFGQKDRKFLIQHRPVESIWLKDVVSSYLRCPMQYYLENLVQLPISNKTSFQVFTIAMASVRDLLTAKRAKGERPDLSEAAAMFSSTWKRETRALSDSSIPAEVYEAAMSMTEAWVDMDLDIGLEAVNVPFRVDFKHVSFESGDSKDLEGMSPVPLVGSVDRVYFGERVRFFLSAHAELSPRTSRELVDVAKLVSLGYLRAFGSAPKLVTVETVSRDFELHKTEYRPSTDDLRQAEPSIAAMSAKLAAGVFQANSASTVCRRCAFKQTCPASSSKPDSRTARRPRQ